MIRSAVAWCTTVLLALAVATIPLPSRAADAPPSCASAEAQQLIEDGHLTEAVALYTPAAGRPASDCLSEVLKAVDDKRRLAREAVAKGDGFLRAGDTAAAREQFSHALKLDAVNAAALDGLKEITDAKNRPAELRWNRFYHEWLVPATKLLVPFAVTLVVLLALSGLLSRWLVRVDSVEWPREVRLPVGTAGTILLIGTAGMFPLYAMFPFTPGSVVPWPALGVLVLAFAGAVAAVILAERKSDPRWHRRCRILDWVRFLVCLVVPLAVGLALALTVAVADHDPGDRTKKWLLISYVLLTLYAVLLTAVALGQGLRLQVAVQTADGTTDAAATDYLLARMQTLGSESPQRLRTHSATSTTSLSTVSSDALSALPAGKVIGALSSVYFALRPDLTWRARASIVDDNRVAVTLSRNGSHARSTVFSRLDLGLPPVGTTTDGDRLRAQLLTGAAAFVLVHLSTVHPQLQEGLYRARNWKSVTLQVIATSASLIDEPEQRTALLAHAVNEDPGYPLARLEYLWALQSAVPIGSPAYRQFTNALEREIEALTTVTPLRVRALYRHTAQRINLHAHEGFPEGGGDLDKAAESAGQLDAAYGELRKRDGRLNVFVAQVDQMVKAMEQHIAALQKDGDPATWQPEESVVPRLAYENACQASFLKRHSNAVRHLRYALPTERDRAEAREDPCLEVLRGMTDFQKLVTEPPATFLDLPVFAPVRHRLLAAGLGAPAELVLRTGSDQQRGELAEFLDRPPVVIDRYRQLAQLAEIHVSLADPAMLQLLIDQGIDSPGRLRDKVRRDGTRLVDDIRQEAAKAGLTRPPAGVNDPSGWLDAARSLRLTGD